MAMGGCEYIGFIILRNPVAEDAVPLSLQPCRAALDVIRQTYARSPLAVTDVDVGARDGGLARERRDHHRASQ